MCKHKTPPTTAERVKELGRQLARVADCNPQARPLRGRRFDTSLTREIEIGQEITRLIEAEPNNRELDEWRAVLAMC